MSKLILVLIILLSPLAFAADTYIGNNSFLFTPTGRLEVDASGSVSIAGTVDSRTQDGSGTPITSTAESGKQALDVHFTNPSSNASVSNNGAAIPAFSTLAGGKDAFGNLSPLFLNSSDALLVDGSAVTQPISAASLPLPVGASTATLQSTGNSSLSGLDSKTVHVDTGAVVVSSSALPAGASTSALQTSGNSSLSSIDSKVPSGLTVTSNKLLVDNSSNTQPVSGTVAVSNFPENQPISGTVNVGNFPTNQNVTVTASVLPTGAATSAGQTSASGYLFSLDGKTVHVDTGNVTVTASALPGGAATSALQAANRNLLQEIDNKITATATGIVVDSSGTTQTSQQAVTALSGSASALNGDCIASIDLLRAQSAHIQVTGTFTGTLTFQGSDDNSNFVTIVAQKAGTTTSLPVATAVNTASDGIYYLPLNSRYLRIRMTTYTSGTATCTGEANAFQTFDLGQRSVNVSTGTVTANTVATAATHSTDIASNTLSVSGDSIAIIPNTALGNNFLINVTAVTGTTPTMDVVLQESWDSGVTYTSTYQFERITAAGQYVTPLLRLTGNRYRYHIIVGGTTPAFTYSAQTNGAQFPGKLLRAFRDSTLDLTTTGAVGPTYNLEGCDIFTVAINAGAGGIGGAIVTLDLSEDNVAFSSSGLTVTTAISAQTMASAANRMGARYGRLRTSTGVALSTLTAAYVRCSGL